MTRHTLSTPHSVCDTRRTPSAYQQTLAAAVFLLSASATQAQMTLLAAVDLSLSHSPRIREAQANVSKAKASVSEARDVYVPVITAGAGVGQSYGYSFNPPTLFVANAQSLIFNFSQRDYIRASGSGLSAADLNLLDTRQSVAEDAATTFLALQHDQQRETTLHEENEIAGRLVQIVQDRLDAGRDNPIDLTQARLTAVNSRVARLSAEDDTTRDRIHLAMLTGVALGTNIHAEGDFPTIPFDFTEEPAYAIPASPAVSAAYASANSKLEQARGDSRYLYRPQVSLVVQYNRYATFTASFKQLESSSRPGTSIGANESVFGVQLEVPFLDRVHQAKARESAAEANRALAAADSAQQAAVDGQLRLRHSLELLRARAEVAKLDQQLAQQQMDVLTTQLNAASTNPNRQVLTPKDEQNSHLAEREKYLALIDANYQLHHAEISLLRQTGQLQDWIQQAITASNP